MTGAETREPFRLRPTVKDAGGEYRSAGDMDSESHLKALHHPVFTKFFAEAATEIRARREIVFVGYSLSGADVHIKALIMGNLRKDAQVVVALYNRVFCIIIWSQHEK